MGKQNVKKGDEVVVISGAHKGKRGRVIEVLPRKQRVLVEGVRLIKKHVRKSQAHPQGAILEREGPLHLSNVMRADRFEARRSARSTSPAPAA